jgi:hypothetical protein
VMLRSVDGYLVTDVSGKNLSFTSETVKEPKNPLDCWSLGDGKDELSRNVGN